MKDEIKETLNKFDKVLENYELDKKWGELSVDSICHLFPNELITIKDYITNLQEENERLKQGNELVTNKLIDVTNKMVDYKSRIDKAKEYLKENCILSDKWEDLEFCNFIPTGKITYKSLNKKKVEVLLNILQGKDKGEE